jgi:hypothetical protein
MTDVEVMASSVVVPGGGGPKVNTNTRKNGSSGMSRIALEPGIELKMNAFMQWAGPMVLAALGMAPSECFKACHDKNSALLCNVFL